MTVPRIPDDAFTTVINRHASFFAIASSEAETTEAAVAAADRFFQSLGLEHENDKRAYSLTRLLLGHARSVDPVNVPNVEVHAGVFGLTLGLMLAEATGWEAPMPADP